ncbi:triose-phosphate isomerase [Stutzerimonas urumqiensis]|uniref:triose-phosphate isomerase n=1 Tax=Stutzerimonas urumqiensis TaxID=638269 RepID=UPI000EAD30F0|nr:triose-phosphate isomerase [Stutzerimonas urumqiensis]
MRRPLVAGNWKMNGTCASVGELTLSLNEVALPENVDVVVLPPYIYIDRVVSGLASSLVGIGAQNCSVKPGFGALTGEVSAAQLKDIGCDWVLVGHSERRIELGESDELVAEKVRVVLDSGLRPIICVGEELSERQSGRTLEIVKRQLDAVMRIVGVESLGEAVFAYEPVWAIGSGLSATPEQAQEVHAAIRARLAENSVELAEKARILYGGSVKPENALELFDMADIDGGLIGGASLKVNDFSAICRAAGN